MFILKERVLARSITATNVGGVLFNFILYNLAFTQRTTLLFEAC